MSKTSLTIFYANSWTKSFFFQEQLTLTSLLMIKSTDEDSLSFEISGFGWLNYWQSSIRKASNCCKVVNERASYIGRVYGDRVNDKRCYILLLLTGRGLRCLDYRVLESDALNAYIMTFLISGPVIFPTSTLEIPSLMLTPNIFGNNPKAFLKHLSQFSRFLHMGNPYYPTTDLPKPFLS